MGHDECSISAEYCADPMRASLGPVRLQFCCQRRFRSRLRATQGQRERPADPWPLASRRALTSEVAIEGCAPQAGLVAGCPQTSLASVRGLMKNIEKIADRQASAGSKPSGKDLLNREFLILRLRLAVPSGCRGKNLAS